MSAPLFPIRLILMPGFAASNSVMILWTRSPVVSVVISGNIQKSTVTSLAGAWVALSVGAAVAALVGASVGAAVGAVVAAAVGAAVGAVVAGATGLGMVAHAVI